jgi:NAD(P)-dependent dehydrogenase (short-subunit alcohol dehydrogenase family)
MSRYSRTVLVTGGVSGIGRAIAEAFAAEGCFVYASARTSDEILQAKQVADFPEGISPIAFDVTRNTTVLDVFDGFYELPIDVLVNAAGTILRNNEEFEQAGFEHVVDVNLHGTMRVCMAAKNSLFQARGCVINIASMLSFFGSGYAPAYSASKGGIAQLTKSLAIAWAPQGVRVNAIAPGWIETALTAPLWTDPQRKQSITARTPLGRWGQPSDIAGAALFLASPAAAFITGAILPVDGGYSVA